MSMEREHPNRIVQILPLPEDLRTVYGDKDGNEHQSRPLGVIGLTSLGDARILLADNKGFFTFADDFENDLFRLEWADGSAV